MPGGSKAVTRVGWGHVDVIGRAIFPWWAGPQSSRTRLQRAMMRWLLYSDMRAEELAREEAQKKYEMCTPPPPLRRTHRRAPRPR